MAQRTAQSRWAVLVLQRAKRKIRELQFNFDVDGFIVPDMTTSERHEGGFVEMALQQEPGQPQSLRCELTGSYAA